MENSSSNEHSNQNSKELLLKKQREDTNGLNDCIVFLKQTTSSGSSTEILSHAAAKESLSSCSVCRICYEDSQAERLISPCLCTGTMGVLHKSCVEKWLGSSNSNKCEICNFEFITVRRPRKLKEWLETPSHRNDRRNLAGDFVCFCLLTPLAGVSVYLCTNGAMTYSKYKDYTWEIVGLVVLSVFLVCIYLVWVAIAFRYHSRVISEWRKANQHVHVLGLSEFDNSNKSQLHHAGGSIEMLPSTDGTFFTVSSSSTTLEIPGLHRPKDSTGSSHAISTAQDIPNPLRLFSSAGTTSQSLPEGARERCIVLSTHPEVGSYLERYIPSNSNTAGSGSFINRQVSTTESVYSFINNDNVEVDKKLSASFSGPGNRSFEGSLIPSFSDCDIPNVQFKS